MIDCMICRQRTGGHVHRVCHMGAWGCSHHCAGVCLAHSLFASHADIFAEQMALLMPSSHQGHVLKRL